MVRKGGTGGSARERMQDREIVGAGHGDAPQHAMVDRIT